ncbi:MAG: hypothetical protein LDL16_06870 [Thiobacillus sp.]|nr:hypothetical protein [Thiobacillus sp.]
MNEGRSGFAGKIALLHTVRLPLWVSLGIAAALLFVYVSQHMAVKQAEARWAEEKTAFVAAAQKRTTDALDLAERQFAQALSWAVRGEMLRNNLDQVDQFFTEIVRMPGYKLALLVQPDGKVAVSTNRRHVGEAASGLLPATLLDAADIAAVSDGGARWLAIPVMGLNSRIGTVVLRIERTDPLAGL